MSRRAGHKPFALRAIFVAGAVCLSWLIAPAAHAADPAAEARTTIHPLVEKYCFDCHGNGEHKGNVNLDNFSSDQFLLHNPELWWRVLKNVRAGIMPPHSEAQPTTDEKLALAKWIKYGAFGIDPAAPDAGRVTVRRLNRVEYEHTIRDLVGVDFHATEEFPPDDTGYGFDTIGDALSVSPMLLEKYVQAAQTIVTKAVPTAPTREPTQFVQSDAFHTADGNRRAELAYHEPGALLASFNTAHPGKYHMTLILKVHGGFNSTPDRCRMTLKIGDETRWQKEMGWADDETMQFSFDVGLAAGDHPVTLSLVPLTPPEQQKKHTHVEIFGIDIAGPSDQTFWIPTDNYGRFFPRPSAPTDPDSRRAYARQIIGGFANKAFRRPADAQTLDRLVALAARVYSTPGKTFEQGVSQAMVAILASPRFLFRVEQPEPGSSGAAYSLIDEYSLASRLSYFFWSSMPDDQLLSLAAQHQLRAHLTEQVQRLLADPRSDAIVRNFAGQWLQLRDVAGIPINARVVLRRDAAPPVSATQPARAENNDPNRFQKPKIELDYDMRVALAEEPVRLFAHIIHDNASLLDLLDANYTYLNEPLARLYDIPDIHGNEMRQVQLAADSPRGGILSMGAFLVVTSNPTRTSPVKRGNFILENILGMPTPPPPPNIPPLEQSDHKNGGPALTFRQVLEIHRSQPMCASCHSRMDPLGISMENFNALGMWRQMERGEPIDASGKLLSGETFHDERDLKKILVNNHRTDFYRCLTEKLLTYALGRGLEYYDVEAVDRIVDRIQNEDGRASALIEGIVESVPFQQRRNFVPAMVDQHQPAPATPPVSGARS